MAHSLGPDIAAWNSEDWVGVLCLYDVLPYSEEPQGAAVRLVPPVKRYSRIQHHALLCDLLSSCCYLRLGQRLTTSPGHTLPVALGAESRIYSIGEATPISTESAAKTIIVPSSVRSNGTKLVGRGERAGPHRGRSPHPFERNPRRGRPPQTHNPRLGAGTPRSHRSQRLPSGNPLRQRHAGSAIAAPARAAAMRDSASPRWAQHASHGLRDVPPPPLKVAAHSTLPELRSRVRAKQCRCSGESRRRPARFCVQASVTGY
ncbi:hypothetical protein NDU88_005566 [Pleurodeles waltl]|uniref:Uncharacterized protein n=1 Tax=Pleurodeles waltl TaxID=8319 RepID=A0AAV7TAX3_PLEWA|nr:hypothetical protein NDU88_005566 [Pleurodeles waltl]